ncbi:MAG TPA: DsbA family protein [bacterium]|nr:DsbA family protein [bacterium]
MKKGGIFLFVVAVGVIVGLYLLRGTKNEETENTGNVDMEKFNSCHESQTFVNQVKKDYEEGLEGGVNGTPAFFIGNLDQQGNLSGEFLSGAQPISAFQKVLSRYIK